MCTTNRQKILPTTVYWNCPIAWYHWYISLHMPVPLSIYIFIIWDIYTYSLYGIYIYIFIIWDIYTYSLYGIIGYHCASCLCPIYWSHVLSRKWRCSWSSADRRCSNYIWVINNLIAHKGASAIRDLTVGLFKVSLVFHDLGIFWLIIHHLTKRPMDWSISQNLMVLWVPLHYSAITWASYSWL